MVAITRQFDDMALKKSQIQPTRKQCSKVDQYDNLFDQLINWDLFDLTDGTTGDRRSSDDWGNYFEMPISRSRKDCTPIAKTWSIVCFPAGPQKLNMRVLQVPDRERNPNYATSSGVAERIISLVHHDPVQNPAHSHSSAPHPGRKITPSGESNLTQGLRSHAAGVSKATQKTTALPKMSQRHKQKRDKSGKAQQRGDKSSRETEASRALQRPISAAPPSSSTVQTAWSPSYPYQPFGEPDPPATGHDGLAFRHNAESADQQAYSQTAYSPLLSPQVEHSRGEDIASYYHSPSTPYFTEADALTQHDFGSYSSLPRERNFPVGHEQSHRHPGLEMEYGMQEYAEQVQAWWDPASAGQPYHPDLAYPAASQHPSQHADPATGHQSDYEMTSGGLMVKRDHDAPDTNFSNSGRSRRGPNSPHDARRGHLGHGQMRQEQLMEPHRRSSSPSAMSQPTRDFTSSSSSSVSTRTGGAPHRRSKTSGASGRRDQQPAGFVNYTPEDSRKILTGVAPSGSSKTKARREKEAAEKQRKLSWAAAKAVLEAGGDLETLEREGFVIERQDEEDEAA